MEIKILPLVLFIMAYTMMRGAHAVLDVKDTNRTTYDKNNPIDLPTKKVLFYEFGVTFNLYQTDSEVRNLVVPVVAYKDYNETFPQATDHPPIFFNMFKDGNCLGQYVMKNLTVHKINDGRDSTSDIPDVSNLSTDFDDIDKNVYIASADGIYAYNIDTETTIKYGTITEDIISIDKVTEKQEFYIINAGHKVYKVINQGNELVPIEAITYAKKLVVDYFENLYFFGEDNVPQVLMKGETIPYKFSEFNFDIVNPVLGREILNALSQHIKVMIPFLVDGTLYILANNRSGVIPYVGVVPGVTAFSAEYTFVHYYAVNGLIYQHTILGQEILKETVDEIESVEQPSSENEIDTERPVEVFDRELKTEHRRLKKIKKRH